jgi:hypothetical protein
MTVQFGKGKTMEDKNIYLVVYTQTQFYDPHGTPDQGGYFKDLDIIKDGDWEKDDTYISYEKEDDEKGTPFEEGVWYNDNGISSENDDREYRAEDGYNCPVTWTSIKIITKKEYDEYSKIIKAYKKI